MASREISASTFKQQCLALLDLVEATRSSIVVTKHGRPVARLVPLDHDDVVPTMGSVTLLVDEDEAYYSTGEAWDADRITR